MAKIIVSFDTVEKTLSVELDGKKVDNAMEVSIMKNYDDTFNCHLMTAKKDKDNDMYTYTRLSAFDKQTDFSAQESFDKAKADINKYFSRR